MMLRVESKKRAALRAFAKDKRGAAAVVMTLLTPVLIAGLAFGAEVGFWELQRRKLQNAVDAAAYAAATQLRSGVTGEDELKGFARPVAEKGGYTAGEAGITLDSPPASGAYAGNPSAIQVTLAHAIPRRFSAIFESSPIEFTVTATAFVQNGRPACVLSLHPTAAGAITAGGSASVTLTGCDLAANSISPSSVTQGGSSQLTADCISTVGEANMTTVTLSDCPAPIEHAPLTADPYADVAEPNVPLACATNGEKGELATNTNQTGSPPPTSGSPTNNNLGKAYCINSTEQIHGTTNLSPGVYVIKCKDAVTSCTLKVNSTATITGDGVTLYLAAGVRLDINGGATIDLSAPTTGDYAGLVVFFSRNSTGNSTINGGSSFSMVGAVYGTNQNIQFSGNTSGSGPGECTQVVGGTVEFIGNSDFNTDCSASGTRAIKTAQSIKIVE